MDGMNFTSTSSVVVSGNITLAGGVTVAPSLAPTTFLPLIDVDAGDVDFVDAPQPTERPSLRPTLAPTPKPTLRPTLRPTIPQPLEEQRGNSNTEEEVQDQFVCSFCPSGQPLQAEAKARIFINVPDDTFNCGFWEDLFGEIASPQECNKRILLAAFDGTFDPTVYCRCPPAAENENDSSSPASTFVTTSTSTRCPLCPNLIHSATTYDERILDPNRIVNGVSCGDYADLAAAATTDEFCQSILNVWDIQSVCCGISPYPPNIHGSGSHFDGQDLPTQQGGNAGTDDNTIDNDFNSATVSLAPTASNNFHGYCIWLSFLTIYALQRILS